MNIKQNMKTIDSKLYFWRQNSKKIIFSNGCFDLLHKGHIDLLAKAKSLGDVLIVALNPMELFCWRWYIIFSIPANAPPQINKMFFVSI